MSGRFSFQNKFSAKSPTEGEQANNDTADPTTSVRRNRGAKQNPLLNAITDKYVDDISLYKPRIPRGQRYEHWKKINNLNLPKKQHIVDKDCWMSQELGVKYSYTAFPAPVRYAVHFCTSNYWDHFYINMLIIWLILIVFFVDGWAKHYIPILVTMNAGNALVLLPPLAAFMTQLFPLFGTVLLMHNCYDCMHFYAAENFQNWAIASCLIAQYIEYFYYGGRRRANEAGRSTIGHPPNFIPPWRRKIYAKISSVLPKSYAKIHSSTLTSQDQGDEDDVERGSGSGSDGEHNNEGKEDEDGDEDNEDGEDEENEEEQEQEEEEENEENEEEAEDEDEQDDEEDDDEDEGSDEDESGEGDDEDDEEAQRRRALEAEMPDSNALKAPGHLLQDILGESFQPKVVDPPSDDEDVEWVEWTCIVCAQENRRPSVIDEPGWTIAFGERGRFLKQTYAIMNQNTSKPTCRKCFTPFDYQPPPASAHLFPHNPEPFAAFAAYPPAPKFPHGLPIEQEEFRFKYVEPLRSFFHGIQNHPQSKLLFNDWMLRKWVRDVMPEINRYKLRSGETYQVGEIVESKVQKVDFCRARVIAIRKNRTYDIRYDMGDEVRFVPANQIRLGFEKGAYAYRVELMMTILWVTLPLGLVFAVSGGYDWTSYAYGMVFLAPLLIALCLLLLRLVNFVQYVINFRNAGCCVIFKTTSLFTLPLLLLLITSAVGMSQGQNPSSWGGIIALLVLTEVSSLPILYGIRPVYAVIGGLVFVLSTIGLILVSMYVTAKIQDIADGDPDPFIVTDDDAGGVGDRNPSTAKPLLEEYIAVSLFPWLLLLLLAKYIRYHLHAIWDTCLVIRPATKRWKSNPLLYVTCMNWWEETYQAMSAWFERE